MHSAVKHASQWMTQKIGEIWRKWMTEKWRHFITVFIKRQVKHGLISIIRDNIVLTGPITRSRDPVGQDQIFTVNKMSILVFSPTFRKPWFFFFKIIFFFSLSPETTCSAHQRGNNVCENAKCRGIIKHVCNDNVMTLLDSVNYTPWLQDIYITDISW